MTTNQKLNKILEEEMPIEKLTAKCGVCGFEFFNSKEHAGSSPNIIGDVIVSYAKKHRNQTGHDDLQIEIDKRTPLQKIDATVTVNE